VLEAEFPDDCSPSNAALRPRSARKERVTNCMLLEVLILKGEIVEEIVLWNVKGTEMGS
jgi:hypothetical protein